MDIKVTREFMSISQENIQVGDIESAVKKAIGDKNSIKSIETSKNGDVNSCYVISMNNSMRKLFLKVENHNSIPGFYSGQIEREHASTALLRKHGLPCPAIVSCDVTKNDIGKKYILTEFVEGQLLSDVWSSLSETGKRNTKEKVISIVEKMKNIKNPYYGDIYESGNRGKYELWKDAYLNLAEILLKDCINAGLLNEDELTIIKEATGKSYSKISNGYSPSFNHMDLHWQNILVNRSEDGVNINSILDFGNSMFGLPVTDEYRLYSFLFFTEEFYDSETPRKYILNDDQLFSCELLYGLEFLVFEGMMKGKWGSKENVLSKCRLYLA